MSIQLINITKKYKEKIILEDINLTVETGELVALLGPSGSGKTSLLRIIAGLELADSGKVLFEGEDTFGKKIQERKVGFVFQHYALFKHMTVFENAAFGLMVRPKQHRPTAVQIRQKVVQLLELMHLEGYEDHYPSQLSGGQQQRIALVRALAIDPKVLLLDEPFGALDTKVRKELCRWIRTLHDEIKVSSVFVTHDQEEALEVADRVCIMNKGKILQTGTPYQVWRNPNDLFIFTFLGSHNEFQGWMDYEENVYLVQPESHMSQMLKLYARPYEIQLCRQADEKKYFKSKVKHINSTGSFVKIELVNNKTVFMAELSHFEFESLAIKKGEWLFLVPKKLHRFI